MLLTPLKFTSLLILPSQLEVDVEKLECLEANNSIVG